MNWWIVAVVVIVIAGFGLYLSITAGRLDHLHQRIDTSQLSLEAQLLRRSSICVELGSAGVLDPAASLVLVQAAHEARTASDAPVVERAQAESDLTAALHAALDPDDIELISQTLEGREMLEELDGACRRVELSRRFHNDAVRACRQVRGHRIVRLFHLAGHTPWPQSWEMDDTPPPGLRA